MMGADGADGGVEGTDTGKGRPMDGLLDSGLREGIY